MEKNIDEINIIDAIPENLREDLLKQLLAWQDAKAKTNIKKASKEEIKRILEQI